MRNFRFLIRIGIGLMLGLLLAFSLRGQAPADDQGPPANYYSVEKEMELGERLANNLRARLAGLPSPELQSRADAYVTQIGQRLLSGLPDDAADFNYHFEVVVPELVISPLEPYAVIGGTVLVPVQILTGAVSEAELAGAIAHGIAHITERHGTRASTIAQASRENVVRMAAGPLIFSTEPVSTLFQGIPAGYGVGAAPQSRAISPAFTAGARQQELEADRAAVRLLVAAGYDPVDFGTYLDRFYPDETGLVSTHFRPIPDLEQRQENLAEAIAAARAEFEEIEAFETGEFDAVKAQLVDAVPVAEIPVDDERPNLRRIVQTN